jgi:hypothetical protein
MFCAPRLDFGGTEGVEFRFHVLRSRTRFRRYRRRRVPILCLALPESFSAVPRASSPVFLFYATGPVFCGTDGVGSRFLVLRSQTHFGRYRWRQVPFSCFTLPDAFSTVPRPSGLVFMFCSPRFVFGSIEASSPVIMFCAPELIFGGTKGVGCGFHILPSRTHFRRYRVHRVLFSCFALPDPFSAVPRASGPVFMFCAPEPVFISIERFGSRFHLLRSRTHFRRYQGCRVPFSCFALPDLFSAVPTMLGPIFMFCAPGLIFGGSVGVESRFYVLRFRTRFR